MLVWLLLVFVGVCCCSVLPPVPRWRHSAWLAEEQSSPRLYWTSQGENLFLQVEANTIGSIHLELDSWDAVVVWVDDRTGEPHIKDGHLVNNTIHPDDESNYVLIGGNQNSTHTSVAFRRRWNTCDEQDSVLGSDTVRFAWSMHQHDPSSEETAEDVENSNDVESEQDILRTVPGAVHGKRSLLLQTPVTAQMPQGPQIHSWDVLMRNVVVSENMATQYWCKIFRSPSFPRKNHIVAYEPLILSPSANLVHHLLLYECSAPPGYLDSYAIHQHPGAPCYSPEMPIDWETCVTPVATWVLGGGAKIFPDHVGLPVGPRQTYFMLEVHYDNPGLRRTLELVERIGESLGIKVDSTGLTFSQLIIRKSLFPRGLHKHYPLVSQYINFSPESIDNSGFRLYYTEEVRPNDAGVIQTGLMVTPLHLIPPQQPKYLSTGLCTDVCTSKMLPEKGVKLISVLLHSHLAGRAMRLRHIRGDREMPQIVEDNRYDFAYQQDRFLNEEVTVFPGDQLLTECEYDTRNRPSTTFGGYSTQEEMCLSFVTYYPRTDLASCHSMPPVKHVFSALGIKSFYGRTIEQVEKFVLRTGSMPKVNKTAPNTVLPTFESDEAAIAQLKKMAEFIEDKDASGEESLLALTIREPEEFRDRDLAHHLQGLPWSDDAFTDSFQNSLARGHLMEFCRTRTDSLAMPLNIESYPRFKQLEEEIGHECEEADVQAQMISGCQSVRALSVFLLLLFSVFL